jgi:hypothetical protein
MLASIVVCSIFASPAPTVVVDEALDQAPAPGIEALDYAAAVEHLRAVDDAANGDPVGSIEALIEAIAVFDNFAPQLSADAETLELREYARLNLARAQLMAGQPELAVQVIDAALRAAMGASLPAESFGPSFAALYEQRRAALEKVGYANLVVTCERPCRIFIEQQELDQAPPLLLGSYAVWVEDVAGQRAPLREQIELRAVDEVHELTFAVADPVPPPPPPPQRPVYDRIMPQWASVTLLLAGAAAMAAGATIVVIGSEANDNATLLGGAAVLGGGAAALLGGTFVLTVDEHQANRSAGRRATLSWSVRF